MGKIILLRGDSMSLELHTLGHVVDNLKSGHYAIKVLGRGQGTVIYVSQGKTLCSEGEQVTVGMEHEGNPLKQWVIVKKG